MLVGESGIYRKIRIKPEPEVSVKIYASGQPFKFKTDSTISYFLCFLCSQGKERKKENDSGKEEWKQDINEGKKKNKERRKIMRLEINGRKKENAKKK